MGRVELLDLAFVEDAACASPGLANGDFALEDRWWTHLNPVNGRLAGAERRSDGEGPYMHLSLEGACTGAEIAQRLVVPEGAQQLRFRYRTSEVAGPSAAVSFENGQGMYVEPLALTSEWTTATVCLPSPEQQEDWYELTLELRHGGVCNAARADFLDVRDVELLDDVECTPVVLTIAF